MGERAGRNRMVTENHAAFKKMMKLRKDHKEFVSEDDMGVFYRNQRLLSGIRTGDITEENVEEYMTKQKMSEEMIPMDWYHLESYPHPQDIHDDMLIQNMHLSIHKRNKRGKVTRLRLKKILYDILLKRVDRYSNPEKYMNNKILCIVGDSGAGKTLASLHLQNKMGANVICSFTTRPPRETEVEGREHHFIGIVPDPNELLAYTTFGGWEYYALKTQVWGDCTVYVVDEEGLRNLKEEHGDEYRIFSVYITRSWSKRQHVGVAKRRMERDNDRERLPLESYDWVIENNSTKKNLFMNIEAIYNEVKNK